MVPACGVDNLCGRKAFFALPEPVHFHMNAR
jgi:hypothetical protein